MKMQETLETSDFAVNRSHKDRLFKMIFGREENKAWTLSLYNAINGTSYDNPDDIQLTTIENAVYMGMANDVSFLVEDSMNLYEHQSSYNPNMPIRMLIYTGMLYSKYAKDKSHRVNLLSSKQQKFPVPKLVCFYNGTMEMPDKSILKLEDAFEHPEKSDITANVTMFNINYGHNKKLLRACQALNEYSFLIGEYRKALEETKDSEKAIEAAISKLPEKAVTKKFLLDNRSEVTMSIITEYDEEYTKELFKEEERLDNIRMMLTKFSADDLLSVGFDPEDISKAQESMAEYKA